MNKELIGIWRSDPDDIVTQREYGDIEMEFKENGELIYSIVGSGKAQKIFMTYFIKGNKLITDQISSPSKQETICHFNNGKLELTFNSLKTVYIRKFS